MNSNSNNNPQPTVIKRTVNNSKILQYIYGTQYTNPAEAIAIAHEIAYKASMAGYLVCTTACLETHRVEVTIHLDNHPIPRYSQMSKCTSCMLTSHEYWDEDDRVNRRVRCMDLYFDIVAS